MSKEVRVRYAPSPTGHLHIGNARAALFNYLFARSLNGKFIVRIEDTDLKRNVEGGEASQLRNLSWLGLDWDESVDKDGGYGPYRQTDRLDIYKKYWQELFEKDMAYHCYCTEEELEAEREKQMAEGKMPKYSGKCKHLSVDEKKELEQQGRVPSVRFKVPADKTYTFDDMVKGTVSFDTSDTGDFVIVKKDGIPTYNFAVVIDDYLMEISHVLRGDDHISNTPRQLMIYETLGWETPIFGHMTLIVNEQRKKLSKRDESTIQFIEQYHDLGFLPETLFNFIALLGWSPEGEEEIFSKEELVGIFDAARLSKSPAVFDTKKLHWMNNHYIKNAELDTVVDLTLPHLQKAGFISETIDEDKKAWVTGVIALLKEKLDYGAQIVELSELFFKEEYKIEEEAEQVIKDEQVPVVLQSFVNQLQQSEEFAADVIKKLLKNVQKETGFKGKQLFMPVRAALTGQIHGPDLNQTIFLLGKEKVIQRLQALDSLFSA
ncbi:glutamate--tRNA ligase [Chengkuizengella axinellae]|uniref:Glutamate--tRNA ligase n=1 Tax=Chengkuizengella axinellae TaxID=3064388 RepID=A0ABT9J5L4_9BACL|nr:glutamate--tRNA ligase [Chengkuizengella sp. 2205SS18-9]MDP5276858.1 glutamate--tRNA ligase [Chengkuizengella sp. 2205SS18-9]